MLILGLPSGHTPARGDRRQQAYLWNGEELGSDVHYPGLGIHQGPILSPFHFYPQSHGELARALQEKTRLNQNITQP